MSRRKTNNLGALAAGRRVVVSSGSLDGPFLAALAKILPAAGSDVPASTWAEGVNLGTDNSSLSVDKTSQSKS